MKKFCLPLSLFFTILLSAPLIAQIELINSSPYLQDFNSLVNTGTSSDLPTGWILNESGTNANSTYTAGTGSSNTGDTYSFGASGDNDRALGGLLSSSLVPSFGASFVNNTGQTIIALTISYYGEQWRLGTSGRNDKLDFQISTDATNLSTGNWIDVDNLDFVSVVTSGSTGALNGNDNANKVYISYTITGLSINSGSTFWIKWNDFNATSSDDGLGIDDFSLSTTLSGGSTPVLLLNPSSLNGFTYVEGSGPSTSQSYVLSGSNLDGSDVTITAPADYEVSEDNTNWFSNITLTSYDGSNTTVYVRLKSGLSTGDYNNETITNSGGGATTQNVTVSGSVTPASVLAVSPSTLSNFTYVYGAGPSVSQSYELSGSGLTPESGNITITGSTNYEVSTDNSTFNNSVDVAYTGGELSATNIYVRLKAGLNTGSYNNEIIANSGGGATTKDVTVSGTVTPPVSVLPFEEDFDYSLGYLTSAGIDNVSLSNWNNFSGTGNFIPVVDGNLDYPDYIASGTGRMINLINTSSSAEDAKRIFTDVNSGSIYVSFLLNVTNNSGLNSSGDYFLTFRNESGANAGFKGLTYIKSQGSGFLLGVKPSTSGTAAGFASSELSFGTTYLVVIKYDITESSNDTVSLWINPSILGNEPVADIKVISDGSSEPDGIDGIAVRQGTNTPNCSIDGIRVATSWNEAPLPVEMTSFTASVSGSAVTLKWRTETELNNYGFEVQRKLNSNISDWKRIGFVQGNGNSNLANEYSYTDNLSVLGKYCYRLKQMDNDGSASYSKTVEVNLGTPNKYELDQNYPNPFNPNTNIKFKLPLSGNVKIIVYNLIGQEVKVLLNEFKEAGEHIINFTADGLNSGVYIYRIEANGFTEARKMTLLK